MPTEAQYADIQRHVDRLLPLVRPGAEEWRPAHLDRLKTRLQLIRHFCVRAGFGDELLEVVDSLLSLNADLWQLLLDNVANLGSKDEYHRVRTLAAEAEGLTNVEELLSGEDTIRDIIINGIAFALNWKSNTIWIDEAVKERVGIARSGLARLQEHIWRLLDARAELQPELRIAELEDLGRNIEQLWQLMNSLDTEVQVRLLIQLYAQLIRLELNRLRNRAAGDGDS